MRYVGGKLKIRKKLLEYVLADREEGQWYAEPFVGGGNVITAVDGNRIGSDVNEETIDALRHIRDGGWLPQNSSELTKEDWLALKGWESEAFEKFSPILAVDDKVSGLKGLRAYAGFALSYGGNWFSSYQGVNPRSGRDYVGEAYRLAMKHREALQGVLLIRADYTNIEWFYHTRGSCVIYCDPPYKGTFSYYRHWNPSEFWDWVVGLSDMGHQVFVSEQTAPDKFKVVWERVATEAISRGKHNKQIERLYTL